MNTTPSNSSVESWIRIVKQIKEVWNKRTDSSWLKRGPTVYNIIVVFTTVFSIPSQMNIRLFFFLITFTFVSWRFCLQQIKGDKNQEKLFETSHHMSNSLTMLKKVSGVKKILPSRSFCCTQNCRDTCTGWLWRHRVESGSGGGVSRLWWFERGRRWWFSLVMRLSKRARCLSLLSLRGYIRDYCHSWRKIMWRRIWCSLWPNISFVRLILRWDLRMRWGLKCNGLGRMFLHMWI